MTKPCSKKELFITSLIIKIFYDIMILQCLPVKYLGNVTYGVDFVLGNLFVGYLVYIIVALISIHFITKKNNLLSVGLVLLLDLYYVPISSSYYLNNTTFVFLFSVSLFFLLMPILNCYLFNTKSESGINSNMKNKLNSKLFVILCFIICAMCAIYSYTYNGLKLTLDINSVYDVRADFVGSTNAFTSILFHFGAQVVTVGALYGFMNKKPVLIAACVFAQLCIFSIARQKSDLLVLLIVIAIWFVSSLKMFDFMKKHFSLLLCLAIVLSFFEFSLIGSTTLFGLFVRRIMYFPSLLNYYYYSYFLSHPLLFFSQDVFLINRLDIGNYDVPVITLISNAYFEGLVPSPNTGLFAEAFMHLGYFGVIIFPFIIIGLTKLFMHCVSIFSKEIQFLLLIQFFLTIMNIPITGGIFVVTFFTWIPFALIVSTRKIACSNVNSFNRPLEATR